MTSTNPFERARIGGAVLWLAAAIGCGDGVMYERDGFPRGSDAGTEDVDGSVQEDAGPPTPADSAVMADGHPDRLPRDLVWPNDVSSANSDPWLAAHHAEIRSMRPRFLVINFANGHGDRGNDVFHDDRRPTDADVRAKAQAFLDQMSESTRYQPWRDPSAEPFLRPEIAGIVNLTDDTPHVNSAYFPRGQLIGSTGYRTVGYSELFTHELAGEIGGALGLDRAVTLGEAVQLGLVHEVILMANQVDGRPPNPPDQATSNILEVAFLAQAYDAERNPVPGAFVKNGIPHDRQTTESWTEHDHNSMPWSAVGRSLRIYFMNYTRGVGCLQHSLAHEFEFRFNESRIHAPGTPYDGRSPHPYLQDTFRRFAGFQLDTRLGAPFPSLYAGGDSYTYEDCGTEACRTLRYDRFMGSASGRVTDWVQGCGNAHYAPGSRRGYDYDNDGTRVMSFCETFQQPGETAVPTGTDRWDHLRDDPSIDGDCGGKFLTWWYQNMPGLDTRAVMDDGEPMLNWWVFMYY